MKRSVSCERETSSQHLLLCLLPSLPPSPLLLLRLLVGVDEEGGHRIGRNGLSLGVALVELGREGGREGGRARLCKMLLLSW